MVMVMYLYTSHIPIQLTILLLFLVGGEIRRQLVKAPLAAAFSP